MSQKSQRQWTREKIVELALQWARLTLNGCTTDSDGMITQHGSRDVPDQIKYYSDQILREAKFLLMQLTINGHVDKQDEEASIGS